MAKRTLTILLSGILISAVLSVQPTPAQTGLTNQTTEAARAGVERLGVGKGARTEITLRDKRKVKGYISAAGTDSFTIVDKKTSASQTIAYADVVNVKQPHHGLKTSSWIIIAGVAAAAVIVGIIVRPAFCDGC